nr:hypothetical protein CFP56_63729 [Quercus suber]
MLLTVKKMGLAGTMFGRVYMHSLRAGAKGITDKYVGDVTTDHNSIRAKAKIVYLREPKVAATESLRQCIKAPVSISKMQETVADADEDVDPATLTKAAKTRLSRRARKARQDRTSIGRSCGAVSSEVTKEVKALADIS